MKEKDPIRSALSEWKVDDPLPRNFKGKVWDRIVRAEEKRQVPLGWWTQVSQLLARPAVTVGYLAVLLLAGITAGYWQGQEKLSSIDAQLSARYVQAIDPYQTPRQ